MPASSPLLLGLDVATQSIKATALDATTLHPVAEYALPYTDPSLAAYHPVVAPGPAPRSARSASLLFAAATEVLFAAMAADGFAFGAVTALSGSAQQHGCVYWSTEGVARLRRLGGGGAGEKGDAAAAMATAAAAQNGGDGAGGGNDAGGQSRTSSLPGPSVADILTDAAFTLPRAPIWQDASTDAECRVLEAAAGGAAALAAATGSRAHARFSAAQILAFRNDGSPPTPRPPASAAYEATARISLLSAYMASLLTGTLVAEDVGDASGMNLAAIHAVPPRWDPAAMAAVDDGLAAKLAAAPIEGTTVVGRVATHWVVRYGFSPEAVVVAWSGDNMNSAAGLRLVDESPEHGSMKNGGDGGSSGSGGGHGGGELVVSLGTSDTAFALTASGVGVPAAHLFRSPLGRGYVPLLCYANGGVTRAGVRDRLVEEEGGGARNGSVHGGRAEEDASETSRWAAFDAAVTRTPPGNGGVVGFFWAVPEILPRTGAAPEGVVLFDKNDKRISVSSVSAATLARAVAESRALAIAAHSPPLGLPPPRTILATGGGARSAALTTVLADVLGAPVAVAAHPASASRGAALRAGHGAAAAAAADKHEGPLRWATWLAAHPAPPGGEASVVAEPSPGAAAVYGPAVARYSRLEAAAVAAVAAGETSE
ncbi:hypothetical protein MMPV_004882 [Pyropia vietnamensis]